jgi:hypothetical protein
MIRPRSLIATIVAAAVFTACATPTAPAASTTRNDCGGGVINGSGTHC